MSERHEHQHGCAAINKVNVKLKFWQRIHLLWVGTLHIEWALHFRDKTVRIKGQEIAITVGARPVVAPEATQTQAPIPSGGKGEEAGDGAPGQEQGDSGERKVILTD